MPARTAFTLLAAAMVCAIAGGPALAGPPVLSATPSPTPAPARLPIYRPPVGAPTEGPSSLSAATTLGMIGVKSIHDRYLQAHTDGELHASNDQRNTEETWLLIEVDKAKHLYALQNYRTRHLMSKHANGCAPADSTKLGPTEKWILVGGRRYGIDNAFAIKSYADGTYLGANKPGQDDSCGGEVAAHSAAAPPPSSSWPGWWQIQPATTPTDPHAASGVVGAIENAVGNAVSAVGDPKAATMPISPETMAYLKNNL